MKNFTKRITWILIYLMIQVLNAEIKLPAIVSSNMVLQRNTTINIWGWAKVNEKINIKTSWIKNSFTVYADEFGNWNLEIKTTNSLEPQTISLKSIDSNIILSNILFGEVWLCSGQSNMEQPLNGYRDQPTYNSLEAITNSKNNKLRLFTINKNASKTPLKDIEKFVGWQESSPETVSNFSAVAYFFGKQLQEVLDVPVGLIHSSYGGSKIEAWMSKEILSKYNDINLYEIDINKQPNWSPTALYNAMIYPILNYKIKGALWYQGESNRTNPTLYKKLFPDMVNDWRFLFKNENFPFYFVQIAPFEYNKNNTNQFNSAFMREAQLECTKLITNSGIAITLDLGDENSIHPPKKKEVADRLLYQALLNTYNFKNINYKTPEYKSSSIHNDVITLEFTNADMGLYAYENLTEFEIAGDDQIFYPADARIIRLKNTIEVKSDNVKNPKAVRYAWRNWTKASLFGTNLLPVSSFRTDNW